MGIVVCIVMLLGLVILRPTPWSGERIHSQESKFVFVVAGLLVLVGCWNLVYGYLRIDGFWHMASMVSGLAMMIAGWLTLFERKQKINYPRFRNVIVVVLGLSFLLYAVTIIQLNLGYPILR